MKIRQKTNTFTHLFGVILFTIGMYFIVAKAFQAHTLISVFSVIVFSMGLILLYLASSIYHSVYASDSTIAKLRKVDHIMIYILIASSYTPICLISLKGVVGYTILAIIWILVFIGIILKIVWTNAPRILYTSFYLTLGWGAIFAIYPLSKVVDPLGILLLFLGGVSYSIGAIIYAKKPSFTIFRVFGFHEVFHVFILIGSILHYAFVYNFVI